ncbi:hypothetical protein NEDG_00043 [Nematocida displodere]|uniref:Uncharacterized protein n=1 Tax=Nematocida displodere TaxID=1805483 RepID=A0A177EI63_9MICR|nr:hypothetical protein NEDG_00043 [Nematocida displodere]
MPEDTKKQVSETINNATNKTGEVCKAGVAKTKEVATKIKEDITKPAPGTGAGTSPKPEPSTSDKAIKKVNDASDSVRGGFYKATDEADKKLEKSSGSFDNSITGKALRKPSEK